MVYFNVDFWFSDPFPYTIGSVRDKVVEKGVTKLGNQYFMIEKVG